MLTTLELSSEELKKLNYERYHYPCPVIQKRLHCLYLKATTGYSNEQIGLLMDAHRNSISHWVAVYREGGYEAIIRLDYGTNTSELENHAPNLVQSFTAQPVRSVNEAVLRVKELTGIDRSPGRVRAFMQRHNFRFLKTGHIPAKVNTTEQKQWVEDTMHTIGIASWSRHSQNLSAFNYYFYLPILPILILLKGFGNLPKRKSSMPNIMTLC